MRDAQAGQLDRVPGEGEPRPDGDPPGPFPDLAPVDLDGVPADAAGEVVGEAVGAQPVEGLAAGAVDGVHAALFGQHAQVPVHGRQADPAAGRRTASRMSRASLKAGIPDMTAMIAAACLV